MQDAAPTVPLSISIAVLDLLWLDWGRTGKASSKADDGRHSGDTHDELWVVWGARGETGENDAYERCGLIHTCLEPADVTMYYALQAASCEALSVPHRVKS